MPIVMLHGPTHLAYITSCALLPETPDSKAPKGTGAKDLHVTGLTGVAPSHTSKLMVHLPKKTGTCNSHPCPTFGNGNSHEVKLIWMRRVLFFIIKKMNKRINWEEQSTLLLFGFQVRYVLLVLPTWCSPNVLDYPPQLMGWINIHPHCTNHPNVTSGSSNNSEL